MKSTREAQRKVRVATGAICRCRKCYCCEEWLKETAERMGCSVRIQRKPLQDQEPQ
jgi:hypothetical protein